MIVQVFRVFCLSDGNTYKHRSSGNPMADIRVERLADLAVNYSVAVKKNQDIFILGPYLAFPLIEQVHKHVLLAGAYPSVIIRDEQLDDLFFQHGQDHQLEHVSLLSRYAIQQAHALIYIKAEKNPKHLANVDPRKIALNMKPQKELSDLMADRIKKGELTWTLFPFPTDAMAQEASMSLLQYQEFVYKACLAHKEDPRKEWEKISDKQEKMAEYLEKKSELHIVGEDTDITFQVGGRKWVNADGKKNMPDGEVFTGPHEDSAEGTIRFTFPAIYTGNEVEDVKLTFRKGVVVSAQARKGEELLRQMIKVDEGASRIGEVAIGTNYEITTFTKDMLFDEKMGGTIHMALGRGMPESGSVNRSGIHWDMLKDMKKGGKIYADGELVYENGAFLV